MLNPEAAEVAVKLLTELSKKGIAFVWEEGNAIAYCHRTYTPVELLQLFDPEYDPYQEAFGVSKLQFKSWVAAGYVVRCSATTRTGQPCLNTRPGDEVDPQAWLRLTGWRCRSHQIPATPKGAA